MLAFFAGILTSFTPCSLSSIPLVIGYVGGTGERNVKKAFWLSLTFVIGSAVAFTVLGVIASTAGRLMGNSADWWYIILGILMILMALQTWGIYEIIPGFVCSWTAIVVVSLLGKAPSHEVTDRFEQADQQYKESH